MRNCILSMAFTMFFYSAFFLDFLYILFSKFIQLKFGSANKIDFRRSECTLGPVLASVSPALRPVPPRSVWRPVLMPGGTTNMNICICICIHPFCQPKLDWLNFVINSIRALYIIIVSIIGCFMAPRRLPYVCKKNNLWNQVGVKELEII